MHCELLECSGEPAALAAELRALVSAAEEVSAAVAKIIGDVRQDGDEALREYTRLLDTDGRDPLPLRVASPDMRAAAEDLPEPVRAGLERAIANVRRVAAVQLQAEHTVQFDTHVVAVRETPVVRAAVYVPGGHAPYPSTVVMGVTTALAAGVEEVAVCSPPQSRGELDPAILGACSLAGASAVYRMGGAHAIAALAYGTESIAPVDVIVGPGNVYVQEAKRQLFGQVGIDSFAGPSDLMVIVSDETSTRFAALDLLAQSEHGAGTIVMAVSTQRELLERIWERLEPAPDTGAIARLVEVPSLEVALALAEHFAPEHLELIGNEAEALAAQVRRAGCLFVGRNAGTAFGDYVAGSNHVLPTGGTARFASLLSPLHFRRRFCELRVSDPAALSESAAPLARAEGFLMHARSMEIRAARSPRQPDVRDNA